MRKKIGAQTTQPKSRAAAPILPRLSPVLLAQNWREPCYYLKQERQQGNPSARTEHTCDKTDE